MPRVLPLLAIALAFVAGDALAWSAEGHRIVARIAEAGLKPEARAEVDRLLADEADPTLAGVATWADALRRNDPELGKRSAKWHYINFDGRCGFEPPRDCPGNNCVVGQTNLMFRSLSDPGLDDASRTAALKFIVHFVADLHQPLHASPRDDKGGNGYQVNIDGQGSNLHRVWDGTILERRGLAYGPYATELMQTPLADDATLGSDRPVLEWALESCRLVEAGEIYPPEGEHVIDEAFLDARLPLAERRLREAGHRLAALLNHALAPPQKLP
ncbi:S1/P1 nuclease [Luteimonas terricola]|uniref:Endonuclease n=1 Tax=Luteimonas terricola TaxID=645597 RepID=A0ABQ2E763_9GAMM|nr:S1/P1 nuclease [Luteimonas terricola]GGJ99033.1 endonuclease [Luteimonas terricola]